MKHSLLLIGGILSLSLGGCEKQSYYTDDYSYSAYPYNYNKTDITLFNSGLTNYREYHGFDPLRQNGSFYNGRFYH